MKDNIKWASKYGCQKQAPAELRVRQQNIPDYLQAQTQVRTAQRSVATSRVRCRQVKLTCAAKGHTPPSTSGVVDARSAHTARRKRFPDGAISVLCPMRSTRKRVLEKPSRSGWSFSRSHCETIQCHKSTRCLPDVCSSSGNGYGNMLRLRTTGAGRVTVSTAPILSDICHCSRGLCRDLRPLCHGAMRYGI